MKFLPSADSSAYGWVILLVTVAAALLPAVAIFTWFTYFRKTGHRKSRRRRRGQSAANPATTRANGTPQDYDPENMPGESKS